MRKKCEQVMAAKAKEYKSGKQLIRLLPPEEEPLCAFMKYPISNNIAREQVMYLRLMAPPADVLYCRFHCKYARP